MRIAIVGTGNVGGALGRVWSAKGHEIVFGAREPKSAKVAELVKSLGTRVARGCARSRCSIQRDRRVRDAVGGHA